MSFTIDCSCFDTPCWHEVFKNCCNCCGSCANQPDTLKLHFYTEKRIGSGGEWELDTNGLFYELNKSGGNWIYSGLSGCTAGPGTSKNIYISFQCYNSFLTGLEVFGGNIDVSLLYGTYYNIGCVDTNCPYAGGWIYNVCAETVSLSPLLVRFKLGLSETEWIDPMFTCGQVFSLGIFISDHRIRFTHLTW